jgi:CDP-diacylglycerol--glycerol-3-phosphate 3-phosphatidyltransferase
MTFFGDLFGLPILYQLTLWVLAAASTYTVAFRVLKVRRQALAAEALPE